MNTTTTSSMTSPSNRYKCSSPLTLFSLNSTVEAVQFPDCFWYGPGSVWHQFDSFASCESCFLNLGLRNGTAPNSWKWRTGLCSCGLKYCSQLVWRQSGPIFRSKLHKFIPKINGKRLLFQHICGRHKNIILFVLKNLKEVPEMCLGVSSF